MSNVAKARTTITIETTMKTGIIGLTMTVLLQGGIAQGVPCTAAISDLLCTPI
jgi:hypothetical protein